MEKQPTTTTELREQAKKLFRAAALLKAADRNDFLTMNCAKDEPLRSEVEKLLKLQKETNGQTIPDEFMKSPVPEIIAGHFAQAMSCKANDDALPDKVLANR